MATEGHSSTTNMLPVTDLSKSQPEIMVEVELMETDPEESASQTEFPVSLNLPAEHDVAATLDTNTENECCSCGTQIDAAHDTSQQNLGYKLPEHPDKVRLGFIPDEWFQMFYKKTGVTGPYVFGTGLILFLLNKEIYVLGPETMHGIAIFSIIIYGVKKLGPKVAEYMVNMREMSEDKMQLLISTKELDTFYTRIRPTQLQNANEWKEDQLKQFTDKVEEEKTELWRLDGWHHFFDAKRENVAMQLEIEFRERQLALAEAVKKRLDYHVDMENMKTRMQQLHMVRWIEKNVIKSITAQQEKELLNKCITDLKGMSASA